jgi:hypothetical protein
MAAYSGSHMSPAAAAPATADGFTQLFAAKNDQTWSGGDQMTSFKAPNGKIYWISGDTILSDGEGHDGSYPQTGTTMVSNRILLQNRDTLENAMADGSFAIPSPVARTSGTKEKYWAQGAFFADGYLYLLCQRVRNDPTPGTLGFKLVGTELAKYRFAADGKLTFVKMVPTPSTNVWEGVGPAHVQWAADAIRHGRYVYVFGYTNAQRGDLASHYSYVARVPSGQVEQPSAWRFYRKSAKDWVRSTTQLSSATDNRDAIVSSQISSARVIAGKIVIAHKPWNGFGSSVYAEVGPNPQGPFRQIKLFESPAGTWQGRRYWTYAPMLHPEQRLAGADVGKTLVSINWNGRDFFSDVLSNADLYKPRFFAVRLP